MRRVSLFTREGNFLAYVEIKGDPQVIVYKGKYYRGGSSFGTTRSFREVEGEICV